MSTFRLRWDTIRNQVTHLLSPRAVYDRESLQTSTTILCILMNTPIPINGWFQIMASWSRELLSAVDRIEYLIENHHQPTNGSYREALLRKLLRRVLPERYRVSTGFIYRGNEKPSRQIDILIWNAQEHSALLEEEELVVLAPSSVSAMIEVKSTLTPVGLRDSLDLLMRGWPTNWMHQSKSSATSIVQHVGEVPFRAIFAYKLNPKIKNLPSHYFPIISQYYRSLYGADFDRAVVHTTTQGLYWANLIDMICIANGPVIEQSSLGLMSDSGSSIGSLPVFAAYKGKHCDENISIGRFCMHLLKRLSGPLDNEVARATLMLPSELESPGICNFGPTPDSKTTLKLWGNDVLREALWQPKAPALKRPKSQKKRNGS